MIEKNKLYKEVGLMSVSDRVKLLDYVHETLDKSDPTIDAAWMATAKSRHESFKKGKTRARSIKSVFGIDV
jgi:hypothetical protein